MSDEDKTVGKMAIRGTEYDVVLEIMGGGTAAQFAIPTLKTGRYAQPVKSETWEGLRAAAMKAGAAKKVRIEVPVCRLGRGYAQRRIEHGVVIGRHASNGNLLISWEGGTAVQEEASNYREEFLKPMSAADEVEYVRLVAENKRVSDAIKAIENRYRFDDLKGTVNAEIERKASEGGAE